MQEQREIFHLIRKLSKNITGRDDSDIVHTIYEHLLNFGEEREKIIEYKDVKEREEHNDMRFSTIQFHLRQRGDLKRADALEYLVTQHPKFKNKSLCSEHSPLMSILFSLFDTNPKGFNEDHSMLLSQQNSILNEEFRRHVAKHKKNEQAAKNSTFEMFHDDVFTNTPGEKGMDEISLDFQQLGSRMGSLPEMEDSTIPAAITLPVHQLENRRTLFGALSQFSAPLTGNDVEMMFSLPPLPDMDSFEGSEFAAPSSLERPQIEFEFSLKIAQASSPAKTKELVPVVSSAPASPPKTVSKEDIWDKAVILANTPLPKLTWEKTLGVEAQRPDSVASALSRSNISNSFVSNSITSNSHQMMAAWLPPTVRYLAISRPKKEFFSESGVDVFDATYKKHFDHDLVSSVPVVPQQTLVEECLCVLQGIPTLHFQYNESVSAFQCPLVRLKSSGFVSLQKLMNDIASVGSNFKFLEEYVENNAIHTNRRGLVCQSFAHSISMFLQFIRACIIDLHPTPDSPRLTLLQVVAHARALDAQLAFVRGVCDTQKTGAALLGYIYDEVRKAAHNVTHQALLRLFLQSAARPYLTFVHSWIYEGRISDPYGEFVVMPSHSLPELSKNPNENFWHEAYLLRSAEYVPSFLEAVLQPLYYCGKAIHVLQLSELRNNTPHQSFVYTNRKALRNVTQPPLRIVFAEPLVQQVVDRTKKAQKNI